MNMFFKSNLSSYGSILYWTLYTIVVAVSELLKSPCNILSVHHTCEMQQSFSSRKPVRKWSIEVLIPVSSLFRFTLSHLNGLGVICILFQSWLSIKWLISSLSTDLVTIHFPLALTDLLNDAIPFSLDGTSTLTLSALNANPQSS